MSSPIESPCVEICQLRKGEDVCRGCHRTLDEIARWSDMTQAERRQIMDQLPNRKNTADISS